MRQLPENFFGWNDHKSIMLTKFAPHRQLGFGGARAAAGAWAKAWVFFAGAGLLQRRAGPVDAV